MTPTVSSLKAEIGPERIAQLVDLHRALDPDPTGFVKYADLDLYCHIAIRMVKRVGVKPGQSVLDLGAGCAYFLVACRQMNCRVLALDLPHPFYEAVCQALGIKRVTETLRPGRALRVHGQFDHITGLAMTLGFDWTREAWDGLLTDARSHLTPLGTIDLQPVYQLFDEDMRCWLARQEKVRML